MIVNAVVSSSWEFRVRVDSPLYSEEGPLLTVPAGTVLPYVGMASDGIVAVLVGTTIAYMVRTAGDIIKPD